MKKFFAVASALVVALSAAPMVATAAPSPVAATVTVSGTTLSATATDAQGNPVDLKVSQAAAQASNTKLTATEKVLASFEVKGEGATNVKLTFSVGEKYAGATVKVFIQHDNGDTEEKTATVAADGSVTITVDRLSIFTIAVDEATVGTTASADKKDNSAKSPQTGISTAAVAAVAATAAVAAAGCVVVARKDN